MFSNHRLSASANKTRQVEGLAKCVHRIWAGTEESWGRTGQDCPVCDTWGRTRSDSELLI